MSGQSEQEASPWSTWLARLRWLVAAGAAAGGALVGSSEVSARQEERLERQELRMERLERSSLRTERAMVALACRVDPTTCLDVVSQEVP